MNCFVCRRGFTRAQLEPHATGHLLCLYCRQTVTIDRLVLERIQECLVAQAAGEDDES